MIIIAILLSMNMQYNATIIKEKPCYTKDNIVEILAELCNKNEYYVFIDENILRQDTCRSSFKTEEIIIRNKKELSSIITECADGDLFEPLYFRDLYILNPRECVYKKIYFDIGLTGYKDNESNEYHDPEGEYEIQFVFGSKLPVRYEDNLDKIDNFFHGKVKSNLIKINICASRKLHSGGE